MHDVFFLKKKTPIPKISQKLHQFWKTPKSSKNPKKLGQVNEMHEKEGLGPLPSEEKLDLGPKILEDEVWSEREWFWKVKR